MRRLILTSAVILTALAAYAQVPTPSSVLGHTPGDDYYLANYEEEIHYFHELAAHSDRVKMFTVGKSTEGRDIEIAVISSPQNLAQSGRLQSDCAGSWRLRRGWTTRRPGNWRALEGDRAHRWRPALHRSGRRPALDRTGVQTGFRTGRSRDRRHSRQRDPGAVADAESRWPGHGGLVVSEEPGHPFRSQSHALALPGLRRATTTTATATCST